MDTIVFLGTHKNGSSREAVRAAERLGFYTVLLTDRPSFLEQRNEFPDVHLMKQAVLADASLLREEIRSLQETGCTIATIVSFIEPNVSMAARLTEEFCDNKLSTDAMVIMEDKIKTREVLAGTDYNPFYVVWNGVEAKARLVRQIVGHLPVVVKSPSSSGSKDVLRANSEKEFERRFDYLVRRFPGMPLLIEEYINGPQYLVETVVVRGVVHVAAVIEQNIVACGGRMIVDGYLVLATPPGRFLEDITRAVTRIVRSTGMDTGACHLELRYRDGMWKLIEMNPRIAGSAMNRMIEVAYGYSLVEETLKLMLGQEPDVTPRHKHHVYTKFLTANESGVLQRVAGRTRARRMPGIEEVYVKPRKGQRIRRPRSMGHRYAYVMASSAESPDDARTIAEQAAALIHLKLVTEKAGRP